MKNEELQLSALLAASKKQLTSRLETYFKEQEQKAGSELEKGVVGRLLAMAEGGKMLRGTLVLLGYSLSGREITDSVLDAALALELTHTALLIHDDIMDSDLSRRGKPAMYRQYELDGNREQAVDARQYGISQGVSVGDIAIFMGMGKLGEAVNGNEKAGEIVSLFAEELMGVGYGQMHDVRYGQTPAEPTTEEILAVYRSKTARYSFSLPLMLGGMLVGLSQETLQLLEAFGEEVGIAFQIRDDELGIFGDAKMLGKPVGSDIRENKKTLLRAELFAAVIHEERAKLQTIYGSEKLSDADMDYVRKLHEQYHVQETVEKLSQKHEEQARQCIADSDLDAAEKALFGEILDFTLARQK